MNSNCTLFCQKIRKYFVIKLFYFIQMNHSKSLSMLTKSCERIVIRTKKISMSPMTIGGQSGHGIMLIELQRERVREEHHMCIESSFKVRAVTLRC